MVRVVASAEERLIRPVGEVCRFGRRATEQHRLVLGDVLAPKVGRVGQQRRVVLLDALQIHLLPK